MEHCSERFTPTGRCLTNRRMASEPQIEPTWRSEEAPLRVPLQLPFSTDSKGSWSNAASRGFCWWDVQWHCECVRDRQISGRFVIQDAADYLMIARAPFFDSDVQKPRKLLVVGHVVTMRKYVLVCTCLRPSLVQVRCKWTRADHLLIFPGHKERVIRQLYPSNRWGAIYAGWTKVLISTDDVLKQKLQRGIIFVNFAP